MTKLLEKAIQEAGKLSEQDQDSLACVMLDEIASEQRWNELFAGTQDRLKEIAREALEEHRAGRTQPLTPDKL